MDVETERLERSTERSPRHKLNVDSGDERDSNGYSTDPSNDVTGDSSEIVSENIQEPAVDAKDAETAVPSFETFSNVNVSGTKSDGSKVPVNENSCQARVTSSGENLAGSPDNIPEKSRLNDKQSTEVAEKLHVADTTSEKENVPREESPHVNDIGAHSVKGEDRQVLRDASSTNSTINFTHDLHENGLQKETTHSAEQQSDLGSIDIRKDIKSSVIDAHDAKLSADDNLETHQNGQDSVPELEIPTLEQLNNIKEPEEPNHKESCNILPDDEGPKEGASEQSKTADETDGWLYVLGHDKLKKRVIKDGLENSRPLRGQLVTLNCVGHLEDGTEVDKHDNLTITLGDGDFIHAFDLCVALMNKQETCEVVTESRFAYGEFGRVPDIPPNAFISYVIELVDCQNVPAYSTMSIADRIKLSNEKRERGNFLYSRNEFSRSVDLYTKALKALDEDFESHGDSAEDLQQLIDTRVKCHNNMAAAQMKVDAWDAAIKSCDVVLKVQPDNVKALFRKGKCFANKGDISAAIPLLKRALKLEPETKIIHQELSRLEKKNKVQAETEKALYQKMLGTDKEPPGGKKKTDEGSSSKWLWYVTGGLIAVVASVGLTAYRYIHY